MGSREGGVGAGEGARKDGCFYALPKCKFLKKLVFMVGGGSEK